jgi:peptidylprolyl isomerase
MAATVAAMSTEKPDVTIPDGAPPTDLVSEDVLVGEGDQATSGQAVEVHYVGVAWSNGEQFDASWDRGETFEFRLGRGQVIQGWDQGVAGMKVGGRRRLTIPPDMGYGSRGAGGVIKGGETLVFVVDLVSVR